MRIAYGVHGYGRGHATRALAVLGELSRRHELLILAGGDAYDAMAGHFPIVRIPTLGYSYRRNGTRSNFLTFRDNAPALLDLLTRGVGFQTVVDTLADFRPSVAISDAEPWTHRAAARLRVPRIGFDHFGIMVYCRPRMRWIDRVISLRDAWVYRTLMGQPERVLVSSFFDAPPRRAGVRVVGTLLRHEVHDYAAEDGDHLLAYFNKGMHLFSPRIEHALRCAGRPVRVYGTDRRGTDGSLDFRALGNRPFLSDLASCHAVISTAGNQLVGEALHFCKPMLVMPEDCVEQRVNAMGLQRLGIGMQASQFRLTDATIQQFLARVPEFRENMRENQRDGRREAVESIERFLDELAGSEDESVVTTNVA